MGQVYTLPKLINYTSPDALVVNGLHLYDSTPDRRMYMATDTPDVYCASYIGDDALDYFIYISLSSFNRAHAQVDSGGNVTGTGNYPGVLGSLSELPRCYASVGNAYRSTLTWVISQYSSRADAVAALAPYVQAADITYRLTNCTAPGAPDYAPSGASVSVTLAPNTGYDFINPASDIYVTNNGVTVQSSYANGVLHFTMP